MQLTHSAQTHKFEDGTVLKLRGDNILVKADPVPTMAGNGLIHLPGNAAEHPYNTGTVLAFGTRENKKTGERFPLTDEIAVGTKVMFIRYLAEQETNKDIKATFGKDIFRIRLRDIVVAFEASDAPVIAAA